jgi:hypothetical protein
MKKKKKDITGDETWKIMDLMRISDETVGDETWKIINSRLDEIDPVPKIPKKLNDEIWKIISYGLDEETFRGETFRVPKKPKKSKQKIDPDENQVLPMEEI